VDGLIRALKKYRYDKELFYETRAKDPSRLSDAARGARFLFLNKTCFNGLWRVNSKGQFNVPFGTYKNPKILDEETLREAALGLAGVELVTGDFRTVTKRAKRGDFVYLDPPYVPLSRTAGFTAYAMEGFREKDQARLSEELSRLAKKGVKAMLSNHDTKETEVLYKDFWTRVVNVRRSINSDITKRGDTREIIVTNWDPSANEERVIRAAAAGGAR
jgi:DNA adenine methylase